MTEYIGNLVSQIISEGRLKHIRTEHRPMTDEMFIDHLRRVVYANHLGRSGPETSAKVIAYIDIGDIDANLAHKLLGELPAEITPMNRLLETASVYLALVIYRKLEDERLIIIRPKTSGEPGAAFTSTRIG